MNDSLRLLSASDEARVRDAIIAAEARTEAEIIPVITPASGRYDRAEDLFGVVCALVLVGALHLGFQSFSVDAWGQVTATMPLWGYLLAFLVSFLIGAALASHFTVLRLPFITRAEMDAEVERRAMEAFFRFRLRATDGASGVLLFISLHEHRVRVFGDDGVARHLDQSDWDAVCARVVETIRGGDLAGGVVEGVRLLGDTLAPHLPRKADDQNELEDSVRYMEAP
ncbi:MAG: TPM domain-containing protein [Gammaproteobacteria bacterium]